MITRPIPCSTQEVLSILSGRQTQLRRIIKPIMAWEKNSNREARFWNGAWWEFFSNADAPYAKLPCRFGTLGDLLWVKEKFIFTKRGYPVYRADFKDNLGYYWPSIAVKPEDTPWQRAIHMPRAASRIMLEITTIRAERLQGISRGDALDAGIYTYSSIGDDASTGLWGWGESSYSTPQLAYKELWESINGKGSWDANPWVWVIGFERVTL